MCRAWRSYSPAIARRLRTSRFSARVIWILSIYGSWLPSVSTQMLYGFRSSVQIGVLIGVTDFQAETTGSSGLSDQLFLNLNRFTQLSNFASATILSMASLPAYFGRYCFR